MIYQNVKMINNLICALKNVVVVLEVTKPVLHGQGEVSTDDKDVACYQNEHYLQYNLCENDTYFFPQFVI